MISATGLFLLAEAVALCPAPGAARLGGGARLVLPVGTFEPVPYEPLGPAPSVVSRPTDIQHTAAEAGGSKLSGGQQDEAADQCAPVQIPII